jgi:hypothetical protein
MLPPIPHTSSPTSPRLRIVSGHRGQEAGFGGLYKSIGTVLGLIGACIAFLAVYVAAIELNGWVIGLALALATAGFAAAAAFFILRYLWPCLGLLLLRLLH